ncbi:g4884 [Coccomyxa elongata]
MLPSAHLSLPEACFWLSVTNLTTIGYGSISPETRLAYVLCTVEHFAGIMMSSLLLGIVFAKASMPTTKTAFSRVCLITARNGVPHLLIRIGNTRGNFLLHPEIRVSYFHRLVTKEGEVTFKGRRCEVTDPTAVAPSLIIAHEIDEASPLHNLTSEDIAAAEGAIFVSVSATDDNSKQSVIARTIFRSSDILWNRRFQDVLVQKDWRQFVDFTRFHDTVPITEQPLAGDAVDLPIAPHDPRLEQNLVQHADIMGRSGDMVRAQAEATLLQRRRDNEESSSAADAQPDTFHESTGAADNQQLRRRGSHLTSIPEETEKQGLQKGYS